MLTNIYGRRLAQLRVKKNTRRIEYRPVRIKPSGSI